MSKRKTQKFYSAIDDIADKEAFLELVREGFLEIEDPRIRIADRNNVASHYQGSRIKRQKKGDFTSTCKIYLDFSSEFYREKLIASGPTISNDYKT